MQTLGLASEQKPSDGMFKRLFWPTIENKYDVDLIGVQGFWLCVVVGTLSAVLTIFAGSPLVGILVFATYVLGGIGVRERSLFAAILVFFCYLLDKVLTFEASVLTGTAFGNPLVGFVALMLLLANVRGTVLAKKWEAEPLEEDGPVHPERADVLWRDKFANRMPAAVWPKGRYVFYPLATILLFLLIFGIAVTPYTAKLLKHEQKKSETQVIEVSPSRE